MVKSMTGYGKGRCEGEHLALTVEIKSVNHRYCEVALKAPRVLLPLEGKIKKRVNDRLKRGRVDLFINQETRSGGTNLPKLNEGLAGAYMDLFRSAQERYGLTGEIPLQLLFSQRDIVELVDTETPEDEIEGLLWQALDLAIDEIEKMRSVEGVSLRDDILERVALIEQDLGQIEGQASEFPLIWRKKLEERLKRLGGDVEYDPQRVAQELAFYADKSDITEEITRFRSHIAQLRSLFEQPEPVGRQMDFLMQELNREVNTMGSKSNDSVLSTQVVRMKSELEKIREQVQNIE